MVCIKTFTKAALTPTLTPFLSRLSAGTEMASYGDAQWNFLLGGGDVTAFLAYNDKDNDDNDKNLLLGCLLRINLNSTAKKRRAEGFGMMLVDPQARGKGIAKSLLNQAIFCEDEEDASSEDVRKLLAVCTKKGQPVYRKLGFSDVGMVTSLTTDIRTLKATTMTTRDDDKKNGMFQVSTYGSLNDESGATIDTFIQKLVIHM